VILEDALEHGVGGRFAALREGVRGWVHSPLSLAAHRDRITAEPLPSYSPDYNPIEYLWKKTKQRATHNQYFKEFIQLTVSVDKALAYFATHPDTVLGLFGHYCKGSGLELKQAT
jgi:hypothetical protein